MTMIDTGMMARRYAGAGFPKGQDNGTNETLRDDGGAAGFRARPTGLPALRYRTSRRQGRQPERADAGSPRRPLKHVPHDLVQLRAMTGVQALVNAF